jgi:hypothetical protein
MHIDQLYNKMCLENMYIYQLDLFKPFVDLYYLSKNKTKFKLFHGYIFNIHRLLDSYKEGVNAGYRTMVNPELFNETKYTKQGLPNFKYKKIRKEFESSIVYFIGYNSYELPIFIYLHKWKEKYINHPEIKFVYSFGGFSQMLPFGETHDKYFTDFKELSSLYNFPVINYKDHETFKELSNKAKITVNKLKNLIVC